MTENQQTKGAANHQVQVGQLTPELVRQVADKVYALLLKDLRLEQERRRPSVGRWQPRS